VRILAPLGEQTNDSGLPREMANYNRIRVGYLPTDLQLPSGMYREESLDSSVVLRVSMRLNFMKDMLHIGGWMGKGFEVHRYYGLTIVSVGHIVIYGHKAQPLNPC